MPRPDHTDITLVLDRSGSMGSVKDATIEAFNGFLHSQRAGDGYATMSLIQFDDQYEVVYSNQPVVLAPELTRQTFQVEGEPAGATRKRTPARQPVRPPASKPSASKARRRPRRRARVS